MGQIRSKKLSTSGLAGPTRLPFEEEAPYRPRDVLERLGSVPRTSPRSPSLPDVGRLEITHSVRGGIVVVAVTGEVDLAGSPWMREQLLARLRARSGEVIVALDGVSFMDASGLGVLATVDRWARLDGSRLRLASPAHAVRRILSLTGMDRELAVFPTLAAAFADCVPDQPERSSAAEGP